MWLLWYKSVANKPEVLLDNRVYQLIFILLFEFELYKLLLEILKEDTLPCKVVKAVWQGCKTEFS